LLILFVFFSLLCFFWYLVVCLCFCRLCIFCVLGNSQTGNALGATEHFLVFCSHWCFCILCAIRYLKSYRTWCIFYFCVFFADFFLFKIVFFYYFFVVLFVLCCCFVFFVVFGSCCRIYNIYILEFLYNIVFSYFV